MKTVLVTGCDGFVGRNLSVALGRDPDVHLLGFDVRHADADLSAGLAAADIIVHLAGVNRPPDPSQFESGNAGLTEAICARLLELRRQPTILFSSSIQAELDNPYGASKRHAEEALAAYARTSGARVVAYRLRNLFGKWCRPNYNSVVATFCHRVAHGVPLEVHDPARVMELCYVDDVVAAFREEIGGSGRPVGFGFGAVEPVFPISLGDLAETIRGFRESRTSLALPDFSEPLIRRLYATYLSYLDGPDFGYALQQKVDPRGELAEVLKSSHFGQIFVSRTRPGITRGNHYHDTKVEKFIVVEGDAVIRFRLVQGDDVIEHRVSGRDWRVVDIPPGYTHSIENVGDRDLVTLFWADEVFDAARPDTTFDEVLRG